MPIRIWAKERHRLPPQRRQLSELIGIERPCAFPKARRDLFKPPPIYCAHLCLKHLLVLILAILQKQALSLAEIENERVRHSMLDYRVHAALNCGSRSCPPLRASLYTQRGLQMQLREQMGRWINDPRGLEIDPDGNLVFNPIFKWFERDFTFWSAGKDLCEIAARHAKGYLSTDLLKRSREGCAHTYFEYDWSLNTATPRQTAP